MRFKEFIINEAAAYLGQKVGDILTSLQELRDDADHMGTRDLVRFSEKIVNQIRRILHSHWPKEEKKHLVSLQKVGVALMKAIEEKDDLRGIISGSATTLEKLVADLGVPIHKLVTTDNAPQEDNSGTDKSVKDQSAPPPTPSTMATAGPIPTVPPGQELQTQPLAGNSGPLNAF